MKKINKEIIRLNRFIAMCGVCSRRKADQLIEEGSITVNNSVINKMGYKLAKNDVVRFNGKVISAICGIYKLY